jgi:Glycosyl hydrolases family 31/Domain of unknown function (DUF5110)/Carbohydrate binding module (family 35)/Carbohydrate binding module (family 6)
MGAVSHARVSVRVRALALLIVTLVVGLMLAQGARADLAQDSAVVSGNARFEVLSPTLIRTEYSDTQSFINGDTFNVIGRNDFSKPRYTTSTHNGWLTIRTSAMTLQYQVGSGRFTNSNLVVTLRNGKQIVTADPWAQSNTPCDAGQLCEAENATLNGVTFANDHTGYTGTGFAAGWTATGQSLTQQVNVSTAGSYVFQFRYANSVGGDGQNTTRQLSLVIDGGTPITLTMPTTADWNTWNVISVPVGTLSAGQHTVEIVRNASDSGNVNIDSYALTAPGATYPTPPSTSTPCAFGSVCSASIGTLGGGTSLATNHNGYTAPAGFVPMGSATATDAIGVTHVPSTGSYDVQLRYSNASGANQTMDVTGTGAPQSAALAQTSSWDTWMTATVPVTLNAGTDTLTISCPNLSLGCASNLDTVAVVATGSPIQDPHAPLGGYRRGLDGQNSPPTTTPGLLYQDGWYLLDDTPSALYDPATRQVTQRPTDPNYQDGYVFAYGQDYTQALKDLATLTGPSELLPRWTYGVWYSEYYNHTAADYENTILPAFRSNHVPLDVLVTDTDFKSPNAWDGWEMNPTEFPDPTAYFNWAHSMGLHTALNIHPSIATNDPQYPAALATAQGPLIPNGSGDCPSGETCDAFDWGNPDQLKAYFQLHNQLRDEGNDIWWLDWCCDNSVSSLPGVTPDAWINQNYAWYTDPTLGRGFALSRAYSSLTAGGYAGSEALPTGPWADKRTTIHFTGDAGSNWAMLAFEVGYTPGEAASTGLSAVSNDIGGFNNVGDQTTGAEPGSTQESPDLYARWVQLGAFQPILRLHGNHSDRLPWQYPAAADSSASYFLNLRENLVPYTYTAAKDATTTGVPVTRPMYLDYPDQQNAYGYADSEYMFGPNMLVAPVTTPGTGTVGTTVWFPPGQWTDYFSGKTYTGPSIQTVDTDLSTMPVFIKSGGIVPIRTDDVTNDEQNPLTKVTLNVAGGANGSYSLYEDNGKTTNWSQSATTSISYRDADHTVTIAPARGSFADQVRQRTWTVKFMSATAPRSASVDGRPVPASGLSWDPSTSTVTVTAPQALPVNRATVISYRPSHGG